MKITKSSKVGTLESNDCLIYLEPSEKLEIEIKSIVMEQFGDKIKEVVSQTLSEEKVTKALVIIDDRGALDYTIKARLKCAIRRSFDA